MIQLLFLVLFAEGAVALLLMVKVGPLRELAMRGVDQVLWRTHLLEASLIGYTLFLAFVIDRLHHYLRKLMTLRKTSSTSREEVEKLQMENRSLREKDEKSSSEMKKLQREIAKLNESMKKLKCETEEHERKASAAEAHVNALQKQSEELLLEYDRLLEDNQILQTQLLSRG